MTPLMQQYCALKKEYPDIILFFQVGDFYELFYEDASTVAAILGVTLTQKGISDGKPIPLCGFPVHVSDVYCSKLVKAGYKVAYCDQVVSVTTGAKVGTKAGKIIERKVTRVLTPGTLVDTQLLSAKSTSYIAAISVTDACYSLVCAELLTGNFFVTTLEKEYQVLETELLRFAPDEIIFLDNSVSQALAKTVLSRGYRVSYVPHDSQEDPFDRWFDRCTAGSVEKDFLSHYNHCRMACRLLYSYLSKNHTTALEQCQKIQPYAAEDFLGLDASTQRNLELVKNSHDGSTRGTLFELLDKAATSMGSRMIKRWIVRPLIDRRLIESRLNAVDFFVSDLVVRESLYKLLSQIGDLERVVGRICLKRATLHDYVGLKKALGQIPALHEQLQAGCDRELLSEINRSCFYLTELYQLLDAALSQDSTQEIIIKQGYHEELDELRLLAHDGTKAISNLEEHEQKRTGINSLKIRYSQNQGYALELTKAQSALAPADYTLIQMLAGKDRFTFPALKELVAKLQRAQDESKLLEEQLYTALKEEVYNYTGQLRSLAHALSHLDSLLALATVSYAHGYVRPIFSDTSRDIIIKSGKHPVIAAQLHSGFIPNDTNLTDAQAFYIITGPNMGGKSTYLRQVALISILAQIGCYVPARKAELPLLDRIFTRIGAGDNLAQGKSTFFLEMEETAFICKYATKNSLVILDEVGRGTSSQDGICIAQAVAEYIHTIKGSRCLFATHYHELTRLSALYPAMVSYHAAVEKHGDHVVLLHTIVPGISENSFGFEVAHSAQLPESIILRARQIQAAPL